jgi:hypothetical protein
VKYPGSGVRAERSAPGGDGNGVGPWIWEDACPANAVLNNRTASECAPICFSIIIHLSFASLEHTSGARTKQIECKCWFRTCGPPGSPRLVLISASAVALLLVSLVLYHPYSTLL